jgi:acetate kinase
VQNGATGKRGSRIRQMANEVQNMEIKQMKQILNEDSGSEGMVELNDRLEEPNIVDNRTDNFGKNSGLESQQSF